VSSRQSAARRKVEAALTGELELAQLSEEEGVSSTPRFLRRSRRTSRAPIMAGRGGTTVAVNEVGEIVEHRPDGTSVVVGG
jgi:hypothetical protein